MAPSRNPFVSGRGRGRGQPSPLSTPGTDNRISKDNYTPPRKQWLDPSRRNPPASPPRAPGALNSFNLDSLSPSRVGSRGAPSASDVGAVWSSSVASSDVGIDERYDDHSFHEVDMDYTNDEIVDTLEASHLEINRRLETEPASPVIEIINKHMDLVTPPDSPRDPSTSPRSPVTEEALRKLKEQTLPELVKSEKKLHEQLHEITSIREWWAANKAAWRVQKMNLDRIEDIIKCLQLRQAELTVSHAYGNDAASIDRTFAYKTQIEEQAKDKKPLLDWFTENDLLMKQVVAQYKELEAQIKQASSEWRPQPAKNISSSGAAPRGRRRLSFVYDVDGTKRIESFSWYKSSGLAGWAVPAKRDSTANMRRLDRAARDHEVEGTKLEKQIDKLVDKMRKDAQDCVDRDQQAEDHADRLATSGRNDEFLADVDDALGRRQNERRREATKLYDNQVKLRILLKRQETTEFMRDLTSVEILRAATVDYILLWINRTESGRKGMSPIDSDTLNFMNDLYAICWLHNQRRRARRELISCLQDETKIMGKNRVEMLKIARAHYKKYQGAQQQLDRMSDHRNVTPYAIQGIRKLCEDESLDYGCMLDEIRPVYKRRDSLELPKVREVPAVPRASDLFRPKFSLLGPAISTAAATAILAAEYVGERQPQMGETRSNWTGRPCYHDVLTKYFTSPDVFPIFKNKDASWTLEEFAKVVNSYIMTAFPTDVLGAFVHYSHRFKQLFRITYLTNRIKSTQSKVTGWETCVEQAVDGPLRRGGVSFYRKPNGLDDVEALILTKGEDFRDQPREGISGNLLDRINSWEPKKTKRLFFSDRTVSDESFRSYMTYWSLTGTFFVHEDPYRVSDGNYLKQRILRIDNGWPMDGATEWDDSHLTPVLSVMQRHFQDIERDIYDLYTTSRRTYNLIQGMKAESTAEGEWALYDRIYNRGAKTAFLCQKVSRQNFHMFLRDCRRKNRLFTIRRDGAVQALEPWWPLNKK